MASPPEAPVALVTGAGSGIGAALCRLLAAEGYRLALVGRTSTSLCATGGGLPGKRGHDWVEIPADMADPGSARSAVDRAIAHFGRLDALVNNAGGAELRPLIEHDAGSIARAMGVNAIGPLNAIACALPHMAPRGSGVIVNVSSMAVLDPFPGLGVYAAAKAALEAVCVGIRNEHPGLRAYAIAPGAVETPMLRSVVPASALPTERTLDPEAVAREIAACITGRTDLPNGGTRRLPSP